MLRPLSKFSGMRLGIRAAHRTYPKTMPQPPPLVSRIEAERKFDPTERLHEHLRPFRGTRLLDSPITLNAEAASALSFKRLAHRIIKDTYYDRDGQLAEKGIWIRKRSCSEGTTENFYPLRDSQPIRTWEAKVRLGGDYADSQFQEFEGRSEIECYLEQHLKHITIDDLLPSDTLTTWRKTWFVKDAKMSKWENDGEISRVPSGLTLVIDELDLPDENNKDPGHSSYEVGELELMTEVVGGIDEEEHDHRKQQASRNLDSAIEAFMYKWQDLFPRFPRPMGKLSAYNKWKEMLNKKYADDNKSS